MDTAKKIRDRYKDKLEGHMMVTTKFDFGWRNGKGTKIESEDPDLFDLSDYYQEEIPDKWKDKLYKQDEFKSFAIYLLPVKKVGGCDGKLNNCLWKCLRDAFGGKDEMPDNVNRPWKLKRMLKLDRHAKVPVNMIDKIEDKCKVKINVSGDVIYNSEENHQREIDIVLSNEHYKLKPLKNNSLLRGITKNKERKPLIYDKRDGKIMTYDGVKEGTITIEQFVNINSKPYQSNHVLIPQGKYDTMKDTYDEYVQIADELKEETNGLINLYECGKYKYAALRLFHVKSKMIRQPEPIQQDEAIWLMDSSMGGLIWADKGVKVKNAYKYDANSRYPSIMCQKLRKFPTKRGMFTHMDEIPEQPQYGIYHCVIHKAEKSLNINKYFRFNIKNKYTHSDISLARRLGLQIDLIQDGQVNCLIYNPDCLVTSHLMFKPFIDYLYPMKQKGINGAKKMLNILWGALCQKNTMLHQTNRGDVHIQDADLISIEPTDDGHFWVESLPRDKYYVTDYARIGPFITAFGRSMLSGLVRKYGDRIKQYHTDGFIVDGPIPDLCIGKELHQFKEEKCGECHVKNACFQTWI